MLTPLASVPGRSDQAWHRILLRVSRGILPTVSGKSVWNVPRWQTCRLHRRPRPASPCLSRLEGSLVQATSSAATSLGPDFHRRSNLDPFESFMTPVPSAALAQDHPLQHLHVPFPNFYERFLFQVRSPVLSENVRLLEGLFLSVGFITARGVFV